MTATVKKWGPAVMMAILITTASSIPGQKIQDTGVSFNDKLAHITIYGLGGAALRHAIPSVPVCIGIGLLYGAFDENYQRLIPNRDTSIEDWIADVIGVTLGSLCYAGVKKACRRKKAL